MQSLDPYAVAPKEMQVAIAHRRGIARLDSLLENSTQERKTT
jgi:hypothetical protein